MENLEIALKGDDTRRGVHVKAPTRQLNSYAQMLLSLGAATQETNLLIRS